MSACFSSKRVTTATTPPDPTKHVNYVRGMVLEVDEFTQEFAYLSGRDRWLAREAIGYGTLRGLALRWDTDADGKLLPRVLVKSGVALSPCGQLICVSTDQCSDINEWLAARKNEITALFAAGVTSGKLILHVTLAYSDCPTDDSPVPGEPCRSAEDLMQPSRITDSFQLELSYEAPLQAEEEALRGFSSWLRKLKIVDDTGTSVTLEAFSAAVRVWDKSTSNPGAINIRTSDVPIYSSTAVRLWATELRPAVERGAALQRFLTWLGKAGHSSSAGTTTEQEFLAEVRRWTPRTYTWPSAININTGNVTAFNAQARTVWDLEIAPKWYAEPCGCRAPNNPDCSDDRLLLGTLHFNVILNASNNWRVVIPEPVTDDSPLPTVDELKRPILGHLRGLQAQLIPSPDPASESSSLVVSPLGITTRNVAMGRLIPGQVQTRPIFGNLEATVAAAGEVNFTFDLYSKPANTHDYLVQVIASFHVSTTAKSQAAVRLKEFNDAGFVYKVTRSNKDVPIEELEKMEFQVNVSIIEKHS